MIQELYNFFYPDMQRVNLVGGWKLSEKEHVRAISEVLPRGEINVFYDGTATGRNPFDTKIALEKAGYTPNIYVVDFAIRPLKSIVRMDSPEVEALQADATCLPFSDKKFDFITTDFLLNMVPPQKGAEIIREMARVLKEDGLISMTVFTHEGMKTRSLMSELIRLLGKKYFASKEFWQETFKKAGLKLTVNYFQVENKPLFYHMGLFPHFVALPIRTTRVQRSTETLSAVSI